MRTNRRVIALAGMLLAPLCACGGGDSDDVEGIWTFSTRGCVEEWEFDNGAAKKQVFCPLVNGPVGIQTLEGLYTLTARTVLFDLRRASCPVQRMTVNIDFERLERNLLKLTFEDDVSVTYQRTRDRTRATASVPGCFNGVDFEQHPLQDL
jgi:hypothetical protein